MRAHAHFIYFDGFGYYIGMNRYIKYIRPCALEFYIHLCHFTSELVRFAARRACARMCPFLRLNPAEKISAAPYVSKIAVITI
jgi:hypothetical protein